MNTIQTKNNFWLLLEKSDDTRIYGSLDSYNDTTCERRPLEVAEHFLTVLTSGAFDILTNDSIEAVYNTTSRVVSIGFENSWLHLPHFHLGFFVFLVEIAVVSHLGHLLDILVPSFFEILPMNP